MSYVGNRFDTRSSGVDTPGPNITNGSQSVSYRHSHAIAVEKEYSYVKTIPLQKQNQINRALQHIGMLPGFNQLDQIFQQLPPSLLQPMLNNWQKKSGGKRNQTRHNRIENKHKTVSTAKGSGLQPESGRFKSHVTTVGSKHRQVNEAQQAKEAGQSDLIVAPGESTKENDKKDNLPTWAIGQVMWQGSSMPLFIDKNGQVIELTDQGDKKTVGRLSTNGSYEIFADKATGRQAERGNLFQDPFRFFILGRLKDCDFAKQFNQNHHDYVLKNSSINHYIRPNLTQKGIDGRGIKIAIMEPAYTSPEGERFDAHARSCGSIAADPDLGVAPGAQLVLHDRPQGALDSVQQSGDYIKQELQKAETTQEQKDVLKRAMRSCIQDYINSFSTEIERLANSPDRPRVISISMGLEMFGMAHMLEHFLSLKDGQGRYVYEDLRQSVLGNASNGSIEQRYEKYIDFLGEILDQDPGVADARQRYSKTLDDAARKGMVVLTAAGNHGSYNGVPEVLKRRADAMANELAKNSEHVILVGSADSNNNPMDPAQYRESGYTNPSNRLDILAQGTSLLTRPGENRLEPGCGTSLAAPYAAGVVALMLQVNPYLSARQIREILRDTAKKPSLHNPYYHGAGFLDPVEAVNRAREVKGTLRPEDLPG